MTRPLDAMLDSKNEKLSFASLYKGHEYLAFQRSVFQKLAFVSDVRCNGSYLHSLQVLILSNTVQPSRDDLFTTPTTLADYISSQILMSFWGGII